jgi:UDP-N-acetylglucosamine 2-epimerase (non-hydrolysing)
LIYGDTNTSLAGALVSAKLKIPCAHIEAGLRQLPKTIPEEINRRVIDRVSDFLFCPSMLGVKNLEKENITENVFFVGDTMFDVYKKMESLFDKQKAMQKYGLVENEYIVTTIHRDFNTDKKEILSQIIKQLNKINKTKKVILPLHPRTRKKIKEFSLKTEFEIIEPVDYLELQSLTLGAYIVITDSGGFQKEAFFANKRAIVLMEDTGWIELIEKGWNVLSEPENIFENFEKCLNEEIDIIDENIYGYGNSAEKIVELLTKVPFSSSGAT